jgi:hypothetical protein
LEGLELYGTAEPIEFGHGLNGTLKESTNFLESDHLKERIASGRLVKDEQGLGVTHAGWVIEMISKIGGGGKDVAGILPPNSLPPILISSVTRWKERRKKKLNRLSSQKAQIHFDSAPPAQSRR